MLSSRMRVILVVFILAVLTTALRGRAEFASMAAFPPLASYSNSMEGHTGFRTPLVASDMLAEPRENLLIADFRTDRVTRLNDRGQAVTSMGQFGQGPGDLDMPGATDEFPDGRIAVLDRENNRIVLFSKEGRYLSTINVPATGVQEMAVFPDGSIYVSRDGGTFGSAPFASVVRYDLSGKRVSSWSVEEPIVQIRREISGRLWVLEMTGLVLYSTEGRLIRRLAIPTPSVIKQSIAGFLHGFVPVGMCQAPDGRVFLIDDKDVLVYDAAYNPVGKIPRRVLMGIEPYRVSVDARGRLWAADQKGRIVSIALPSP